MRHDLIKASTKYNDLLGSASADKADYPDAPTLESLFRDAGLDLDTYYPVAYSFDIPEETHFPEPREPDCYLIAHCVLREEVGTSQQEIEEAADPEMGLPTHRFFIEVTPGQFLKLFKRFQVTFPNGKGNFRDYHSDSFAENVQESHFLPEDA